MTRFVLATVTCFVLAIAIAPSLIAASSAKQSSVNPFPRGYCTWGAWNLAPWLGSNVRGNAGEWYSAAKGKLPTGSTPVVGAVFVKQIGKWGHVGVVTKVVNSTTFKTKEMNGGAKWVNKTQAKTNEFDEYRIHTQNTGPNMKFIYKPGTEPGVRKNDPRGKFESATSPAVGQVKVRGWTFDPDKPTTAIKVHVYVGGKNHKITTANLRRNDVAKAFAKAEKPGAFHGFDTTLSTSLRGKQEVCVYAINIGKGKRNPKLGCKTVTVKKGKAPSKPKEPASPGAGDNGTADVNSFAAVDRNHRRIDLNGDGRSDIAWVARASDGEHRLHYRASGQGSVIIRGLAPTDIAKVYFGDFDGNGITDFAYRSGGEMIVRWNNTGSKQRLGPDIDRPDDAIRVGDFNGDGKDDLAWVAKAPDGQSRLHYRAGGGGGMIARGLLSDIHAAIFGDFDGNGTTDFAFRSGSDLNVRWNSNGAQVRIGPGPPSGDIARFRVADVNGDKRSDVVWVTTAPDQRSRLHFRSGGGGSGQPLGLAPDIRNLLFGDFDGNGVDDFSYRSGGELIYRKNSNGEKLRLGPGPANGAVHLLRTG